MKAIKVVVSAKEGVIYDEVDRERSKLIFLKSEGETQKEGFHHGAPNGAAHLQAAHFVIGHETHGFEIKELSMVNVEV